MLEVIGGILREVIPVRAEVIVHHIQNHCDALRMRRIHQFAEIIRPAVASGRGEELDSIVSPAAVAGEIRERHDLQGIHSELPQVCQALDGCKEGALRRKGAYMDLIDDEIAKIRTAPSRIPPFIRPGIDHLARAMDPLWLEARHGRGKCRFPMQMDQVTIARTSQWIDGMKESVPSAHHRHRASHRTAGGEDLNLHGLSFWRPDGVLHAIVEDVCPLR